MSFDWENEAANLRERVDQASNPVEWLIEAVLLSKTREADTYQQLQQSRDRAHNLEFRLRKALGLKPGEPLPDESLPGNSPPEVIERAGFQPSLGHPLDLS